MKGFPWPVALAAVCALLGSLGQLLFKIGASRVAPSLTSWFTNGPVLLGMLLYGLSAVLFIVALKHGNLSVLYPVIATSYIWVALLSTRVLNEPFSLTQWSGVLLVITGIALVVR